MNRAMPLLLAALLLAVAGRAWAAPAVVLDQVRIAVDNKVVTAREYQQLRNIQEQEDRAQYSGDDLKAKLKTLDHDLTERLIEDLLLEAYASRLGIEVSDQDIENRVDTILRRQPNLQQLYTDEQLKAFVLKDILRRRVLAREVDSKVRVTHEDVVAACRARSSDNREVNVGHILIRNTSEAARKELLAIRKKLLAGASFDEMALKYSQDPSVKSNKGHLGFIARGQFVKPFEDAAFRLPVGAVSEPVKTRFGLHLIKVFGERSQGKVNCEKLDDVTTQSLQNEVYAKHRQEELKAFLARIRRDADIHVFGAP